MLMEVQYQKVEGIYLTTNRRVIAANWDGSKKGDYLFRQLTEDVKFNNEFPAELFTIQ